MHELQRVSKTYRMGNTKIHALRDVTVTIHDGEFVSVIGPSGSGKSTLLHIIGGLDTPTQGRVLFKGRDLHGLSDQELSRYRNQEIGFVFQTFNLTPHYTALENVVLPLQFRGRRDNQRLQKAENALRIVGLSDRLSHRPSEMSGGERQRVAIARALVTDPSIILADEPTGNLDFHTGEEIIALLADLNKQKHMTVVIITHDSYVAEQADRVIHIRDGIIQDERVGNNGRNGKHEARNA